MFNEHPHPLFRSSLSAPCVERSAHFHAQCRNRSAFRLDTPASAMPSRFRVI